MSRMIQGLWVSWVMMVSLSCAPVRSSPFSEQTDTDAYGLNARSLSAVLNRYDDSKLKFTLLSDSHANYEDLESTVRKVNALDSDFVVHLGDMTDLGLAVEYDGFISVMSRLQKPWFTVIGNHDTVGNGKNIYRRIFGPFNSSFDLGGFRFILFNNNKLDFYREGIDLDWLLGRVEESPFPVILFQHVDPFNRGYFDGTADLEIRRVLDTGKVVALFHGHLHVFRTSFYKNTIIQQIARTEDQQFAQVQLSAGNIQLDLCKGDRCETLRHNFDNDLQ